MSRLSDTTIQEAIDAVESGLSVDEVLVRYSGQEAELRPILETTVQLSQIRVAHSLHAQEQSRGRMLAAAEELRSASEPGNNRQRRLPRLAFGFAGLVIILLILSYGLATASSSAIPGDALYGPKQFFETMRLSLESDPAERESLEAQFAQERVREVALLLDQGREAEVAFGGMINSIDGDQWIVAGLPVSVDATTEIIGQPQNGAYADIKGETKGKVVSASSIEIRTTGKIEPDVIEPEPTVEETPVITTTIPHTPAPSSTPTATPTSKPASTPTPTPTAEHILPQPEATIDIDDGTEEPGGGSDDSGDDDPDDGEDEDDEEEEEEEEGGNNGSNGNGGSGGDSDDDSSDDDDSDSGDNGDKKDDEEDDVITIVQLTTD